MKFRFYIVDCDNGDTFGTDDAGIAREFSEADEFVVMDTESGKTWTSVGEFDIPEHGKG